MLLISLAQTAKLLSISRTTLDTWERSEQLPAPVIINNRKRYKLAEIESWVSAGCPTRAKWEERKNG